MQLCRCTLVHKTPSIRRIPSRSSLNVWKIQAVLVAAFFAKWMGWRWNAYVAVWVWWLFLSTERKICHHSRATRTLGVNHSKKKIWKLRFCAHRIQFFLLIPKIVFKNHRMHLNPLYDRKTDLGQPTQFRKKIKTRRKAFYIWLS